MTNEITKQQRLEMLAQEMELINIEIQRLKAQRRKHEREANEIQIELFGLHSKK